MTTATKVKTQSSTQKVVFCGLFSAISFVLYLLEFPVIPAFSYLKLDFSEIPALVGAIFFGPAFGIIVELIKNIIELLVKGLGTQMGFGNLMNFLVGCAYIVPFSLLYNKFTNSKQKDNESKHTLRVEKKVSMSPIKAIVISSIVSIISIIVMGIVANYLITPSFFKFFFQTELSSEVLWSAIWAATAMNAIKGAMLSILIYPFIKLFSKIKIV